MEKTYWNNNGNLAELNAKLEKLIPVSGSVAKPWKNKELERFRKASNAYYDIFNNGGCNRMKSISKIFGTEVTFRLRQLWENRRYFNMDHGWERIHAVTEPKMDELILAAAREQGLV